MKNLLTLFGCMACLVSAAQHTLVIDINNGPKDSSPVGFTILNNKLYFLAATDNFGSELWMHDGITTSMMADVNPTNNSTLTYESQAFALDNWVYFASAGNNSNEELWKYDGVNPPVMIADLWPGPDGSMPKYINALGGKLYFFANTPTEGSEMRSYDPSTGQINLLLNIAPSGQSSAGTMSCVFNGKLYFGADDKSGGSLQLWEHDPVANYTSKVGSGTSVVMWPDFIISDNKLYFIGTSPDYGNELYSYDGSNVIRLTDIAPGPTHSLAQGGYGNLIKYKNLIYVKGLPNTAPGIWAYDPLTSTTSQALSPQFTSLTGTHFYLYAGKLYFGGSYDNSSDGVELYRYNGTGTAQLAADIIPGSGSGFPGYPILYGNHLYFSATTAATGRELFKFYDSDVTGVSSVKFTAMVTVFPNPSTGVFSVDINLDKPATFTVLLYDVNGRKVYNGTMQKYQTGRQQLSVPGNDLAAGNYTLKLCTDAGETFYTTQLMKR